MDIQVYISELLTVAYSIHCRDDLRVSIYGRLLRVKVLGIYVFQLSCGEVNHSMF